MASPAAVRLPPELERLQLRHQSPGTGAAARGVALSTTLPALDALLPDGGLPRGAVTELSVTHGLGLATSVALRVLASAQAVARQRGGESALVAFLDPGASLHGPGAQALGVDLERMLVLHPPLSDLPRIAVRVVQSHVFAAVVIDTTGILGARLSSPLASWATAVRRVALAAEGCDTVVLLLTDRDAPRPLPLPVALRLELTQTGYDKLLVRVAKERRGHLRDPHELSVARTIPTISPLTITARKAGLPCVCSPFICLIWPVRSPCSSARAKPVS